MKIGTLGIFAFTLLTACDSGYQKVTVATPISISTPSNLLQTQECVNLWGRVQYHALNMDKASKDWNDVVIDSVGALIESGCVKCRTH